MPRRLAPVLVSLVTALGVALALFHTALAGGLVSDDFLAPNLFCAVADDGSLNVRWSGVLADFARPWLGNEDSTLYRPVLSVLFALDFAWGGGDPGVSHAINLALHVVAATAAGVLCALLCRGSAVWAAALGAAIVAAHPIAVEPVAWLSARNSGLEVALRTLGLVCFAASLRAGSSEPTHARRAFTGAWVFAALALGAKESGVLFFPSALAIDLLVRDVPLRERVRTHASFALLVVAYFGVRWLALGTPLGSVGATAGGDPFGTLVPKLRALVAPSGPSLASVSLLWVLPLYVLAAARPLLAGSRGIAALVVVLGWWLVHLAPSLPLPLHDDLAGSRLLYGLLPPFAAGLLALAFGAAGTRRDASAPSSGPAIVVALATAAWLAGIWSVSTTKHDHYVAVWDELATVRTELASVGASAAADDRPLALLALPQNRAGVPVLNENAHFALVQRPHADRDVPARALGFVTVPVPHAADLLHDASPVRALLGAGSTVVVWNAERHALDTWRRSARDELALQTAAAARDETRWRATFAAPIDPLAIEAVTIRVRGPTAARARRGHVGWLPSVDQAPLELRRVAFGTDAAPADAATPQRFDVDLSHAFGLVAFRQVGVKLPELVVELDGDGFDASTSTITVEPHGRVPRLELAHEPLRGARHTLDAFVDAIVAPALPADAADDATMRLVLVGPHAGFPIAVEPGRPIAIPAAVRRDMASMGLATVVDAYSFWFEVLVPPGRPGAARSDVDRVEFAIVP